MFNWNCRRKALSRPQGFITHLHIYIYKPKKNAEECYLGYKIELGPSQLLISLTPENQTALMFLKYSGHLLYCLTIILMIKGEIKAEQSWFLISLGAPKIRLDGVASNFFLNATGAWGNVFIKAFLFQAGMCRGNRSWGSTEQCRCRGTSGHGGGCRLFCAESTKL